MMSGLRSAINSRVGKVIALAMLVLIAIAFAATDMSNITPTGMLSGNTVATVGKAEISDAELTQRVRIEVDSARQRQPLLDMSQFIAAGGLDNVLQRLTNSLALEQFAQAAGMTISQQAIDGEIASIPAFQGLDGNFSQQVFEAALSAQRISVDNLRNDIRREKLARLLLDPTLGASQVPNGVGLPYASLLLERRKGQVAFVPIQAVGAGEAPTDAVLTSYYQTNRSRYTIPERRVIRYAAITPQAVAERAQPGNAEIASAYRAAGPRFAQTEQRTLGQVIVADQNVANQIAARVRGGAAISSAAQAVGLEATTLTNVSKADYAGQSAAAVADAAFAADQGNVAGPVRSPLGWHVVRVEGINMVAGKTLAEATPEIREELIVTKTRELLGQLQDQIDDGITGGATFDEIATDVGLTSQRTAPLLATGANPDEPQGEPDPVQVRLAQAGFAVETGDQPQIVATDAEGAFALVQLERVIPAAPPPLAQVREIIARDFRIERALQGARREASAIVGKVNAGATLSQAISQSDLSLPPVQPLNASRAELARNQSERLPPPLELMFTMAQGTAKLVAAEGNNGYFVVRLDEIERGNATENQPLINSSRAALGSVSGAELTEQFVRAVERSVGVQRNQDGIDRVKADLSGQGSAAR